MLGNSSTFQTRLDALLGALRDGSVFRARPLGVRGAVEIGLVIALAFQVAVLIWVLATPMAPLGAPRAVVAEAASDAGILGRFDAFFRTGSQSELASATSDASGALRLFGVRVGGSGGGSAIIGTPDGRQQSFAVGETIEPGLTLYAVSQDYVTLARGASRSRLDFSQTPAQTSAPPPPTTAQVVTPGSATAAAGAGAQGPQIDAQQFAREASLRPRQQNGEIRGFTVQARGNGQALRAAGLQSGDVILEVNGMNMNSLERATELEADLANATDATIRYERDGQVRTTTMRIER